MSGVPATSGVKPVKTMSSRLLTMKFMQRAAATAAAAPPPPSSSFLATQSPSADEPDVPSPKRPRLSSRSKSLFSHGGMASSSDMQAISAAVAAEDQKRNEAIARQAAEAGETEWVLEFSPNEKGTGQPAPSAMSRSYFGATEYPPQPHIVPAGLSDAEDDDMAYAGRRSYGNYKPKKKTEHDTEDDPDDLNMITDAPSKGHGEFDMVDPLQVEDMIRRASARADKQQKQKQASRASKGPDGVKLSRLTSISGSRGGISKSFHRSRNKGGGDGGDGR